jgi:hypothetical protein
MKKSLALSFNTIRVSNGTSSDGLDALAFSLAE